MLYVQVLHSKVVKALKTDGVFNHTTTRLMA